MDVRNDIAALYAEYAELTDYSEMTLDDIDTTSRFGDKPVNIAATRGIRSEDETYLAAGADVNNGCGKGYRSLHNAVGQGA